ncbi:MAG TPA: hypothetical protein VKY19_16465 [Ktedonosporobacter sp.]|nr:hypothetical protein [Ktedonosporobacter sp.]
MMRYDERASKQGKREAPTTTHAHPLAPTVSPHDCLPRCLFSPPRSSMGAPSGPQRNLNGTDYVGPEA